MDKAKVDKARIAKWIAAAVLVAPVVIPACLLGYLIWLVADGIWSLQQRRQRNEIKAA